MTLHNWTFDGKFHGSLEGQKVTLAVTFVDWNEEYFMSGPKRIELGEERPEEKEETDGITL